VEFGGDKQILDEVAHDFSEVLHATPADLELAKIFMP
jgi:hypothetical protein